MQRKIRGLGPSRVVPDQAGLCRVTGSVLEPEPSSPRAARGRGQGRGRGRCL